MLLNNESFNESLRVIFSTDAQSKNTPIILMKKYIINHATVSMSQKSFLITTTECIIIVLHLPQCSIFKVLSLFGFLN